MHLGAFYHAMLRRTAGRDMDPKPAGLRIWIRGQPRDYHPNRAARARQNAETVIRVQRRLKGRIDRDDTSARAAKGRFIRRT
jgi:hypothetical protein